MFVFESGLQDYERLMAEILIKGTGGNCRWLFYFALFSINMLHIALTFEP